MSTRTIAATSRTGGKSKSAIPLTPLQQRWTDLYTSTLPKLAASHGTWPVRLDHCFARIILDNAVGIDKPWPQVVAAPATRNMSSAQLKAVVALGEKVADGSADLWELDERSLKLRGKTLKARRSGQTSIGLKASSPSSSQAIASPLGSTKRKVDESNTAAAASGAKKTRKQEAAEKWSAFSLLKGYNGGNKSGPINNTIEDDTTEEEAETLADIRHIISSSPELTPFRRDTLLFLTQVPRGRYTTYQALSDAMANRNIKSTTTSVSDGSNHEGKAKSGNEKPRASGCARAVGMAMRTNPFAPTVPCHRVLASDGKIGGFKGDWGTEGRFYNEKMRLLTEEGVRFDGKGKVIGEPFRAFVS